MFLQGFLLIVQQKLSLKVELLLKYELLCGLTKRAFLLVFSKYDLIRV